MKSNFRLSFLGWIAAGCVALTVNVNRATAADSSASASTDEAQLIKVLQSDAAPGEKAIACKRLAIYGSKNAVPALANLLSNPDLSSWARIALEAIPDPASDAALRQALETLNGRVLIGVINTIGVRRDAEAVGGLGKRLKDADVQVAAAAAEALGSVGGDAAAQALAQALDGTAASSSDLRSSVALGCVLCAEHFLKDQQPAKAVRLYDKVRAAALPRQRIMEATRGAILARGSQGLPLLLEQLRSSDKEEFGLGLRTARELAGADITRALAAELGRFSPERQPSLLLAVADRRDEAVLPAVLAVAKNGSPSARLVAVQSLDQLGDVSCVPVLLGAATAGDAELAKAAKQTLGRLEGEAIDAALLHRLGSSEGAMRQALLEMAGQRRIGAALPVAMQSLTADQPAVRKAAVDALGALGGEPQVAELVKLLSRTEARREQADLERALLMISSRVGRGAVTPLRTLLDTTAPGLRVIGLHLLASVGGPEALNAVVQRLEDKDDAVQDEAVRVLSSWPGNWPQDTGVAAPLLNLARTGKKSSHQIQGVRGYLDYVREDHALSANDKLAKVDVVMPLIQRPEEKRLVIAVLSTVPNAASLAKLSELATEPAVAEEACVGLVSLASKDDIEGASVEVRRKALQTVVDTSKENRTRRRAQEALKLLQ